MEIMENENSITIEIKKLISYIKENGYERIMPHNVIGLGEEAVTKAQ
jgi:hypothetical protein